MIGRAGDIAGPIGRAWSAIRLFARDQLARQAAINNFLKEVSYAHGLLRCLGGPQVYELETTNACPYTCIMCPRTYAMSRPVGHMPFELFRSILDQMRPVWQMDRPWDKPIVRLLHYGEPMVYPHYAESIDYCHRRGFHVFVSTNPSVWTDRRIEETLDAGLDEMLVMVDGMDDETSMAIRGPAASFTRGERNIRELARRKVRRGLSRPHITVAMIRQPRNAHQWTQFSRYWQSIDGINATYLGHFSTFDSSVENINRIGAAFDSHDSEHARQVQRQLRLARYACYYPWHSFSITWRGEVVPCCRDYDARMVLGELRKQTLLEIWNGSAMQRLRRNFLLRRPIGAPCGTCREASLEIGLPGRHYLPARLLRRFGLGRMNRADRPLREADPMIGQQNLNRAAFARLTTSKSPRFAEPVEV